MVKVFKYKIKCDVVTSVGITIATDHYKATTNVVRYFEKFDSLDLEEICEVKNRLLPLKEDLIDQIILSVKDRGEVVERPCDDMW